MNEHWGWLRLVVFLPAFILLLKWVGFHRLDSHVAPAKVFLCLLLALVVCGGVEWVATSVMVSR